MKARAISVLVFLFGFCPPSFSQEGQEPIPFPAQHILSISSGVGLHTVRDDILSPFMYSGTRLPAVVSYRYRSVNNRHTVTMGYSKGSMESSLTNMRTASHYIDDLSLNVEYTFATNAISFEAYNTSCFLGVRLTSLFDLRDHHFARAQKHVNAEQMTGLGMYLLMETSLSPGSPNVLRCEFYVPFVSYALLTNHYNANVSGSIEEIDYDRSVPWQIFEKGSFVSFGGLFEMQAGISYNIAVSRLVGVDLQYRLQYYSFEEFQDLFHAHALSNHFLLGLMVTL